MDGFGLVALAVMVPMLSVQLYGILVFSNPSEVADITLATQDDALPSGIVKLVLDLFTMFRDVLPIILTVLFFQYLVFCLLFLDFTLLLWA